jgi:hypothetical protein
VKQSLSDTEAELTVEEHGWGEALVALALLLFVCLPVGIAAGLALT